MTLKDEYDRLCATPSDIYLHLPRFVDLVTETGAQHVIELGTRTGVSTIAWLYGLEQTGGRLTSIDIDEKPAIADHPSWTFIQGDDLDPDIVMGLDPADIVFIDTSHLYEQTIAELRMYRWLVKPGGFLVLHDTELPVPETAPAGHPLFPVRKALTEFCADEGYEFVNIPECWGLGIVRM
jgi:cephalosporin hydroxylase